MSGNIDLYYLNSNTTLKPRINPFEISNICSSTEELSSLMIPLFFITFVKTLAMQILQKAITRAELAALAENTFGDMIKCVADVKQGLLALDAELHADLERLLLENGSAGEDLWGFNLYPDEEGDDFIEYDSLINIRSWQGNPSRGISNPETREAIEKIVAQFIIG